MEGLYQDLCCDLFLGGVGVGKKIIAKIKKVNLSLGN